MVKKGDSEKFDKNWTVREESYYTHWTRGEIVNQIQLAFRNHWTLFNEIIGSANGHTKGKKVLEVGCGRGSLSCYFSDNGYECSLVDISPSVIEIAENIFRTNNLNASFHVCDANNLCFEDESFDIVFSIGLLEHFEDIDLPIKEQLRVLKGGGIVFFYIVPKYNNNVQKDYEWINRILKGYMNTEVVEGQEKQEVYRSDYGSEKYLPVLRKYGLKEIHVEGVYPLPMISHSIEFPFSLMPDKSERAVVSHFEEILRKRKEATNKHPWLCEEGYGQAFLVWGVKQ